MYALPNNKHVADATISLLKLGPWDVPHESMGIFENIGEISDKEKARFTTVSGKNFSIFSGSRERFVDYLREHL